MPSTSAEPTPYTLPASLSKNSKGESEEENASKLEKDLLLAFEEQDKLLSALAPALSSPRLWHQCTIVQPHSFYGLESYIQSLKEFDLSKIVEVTESAVVSHTSLRVLDMMNEEGTRKAMLSIY